MEEVGDIAAKVTLKELLEAGVHFGHQAARWEPRMKPYIFGKRNGIHIIDLQKTVKLLGSALRFIRRCVAEGDQVLFVGTKPQAQLVIEEEAQRCRMPFVTNRWLGGMLTNYATVRKSLDRIDQIDALLAEGSVERLPKKEVSRLEKEKARLLKNLRGIRHIDGLPGALFLVDPRKERIAVREANRLSIPVVALVDTNCSPEGIDYIIPGNDDAIRSIRLIARYVADACLEGVAARKAVSQEWAPAAAVPTSPEEGGPEVVIRGVGQLGTRSKETAEPDTTQQQ